MSEQQQDYSDLLIKFWKWAKEKGYGVQLGNNEVIVMLQGHDPGNILQKGEPKLISIGPGYPKPIIANCCLTWDDLDEVLYILRKAKEMFAPALELDDSEEEQELN